MKTKQTIAEKQQVNELLGGLKGMMGGVGYSQGEEQSRVDKATAATASQFATQWISMAKNNPATNPEDLTNYATKISGSTATPFSGDPRNAAAVTKYITQELARGQMAKMAPAPKTTQPNPAPGPTPSPTPGPKAAGMTKDQILQWIRSNAKNKASLDSFAKGIGLPASATTTQQPAPADATAASGAKKHTGGRVAGQPLSQTPNAIKQRDARAAKKTAAPAGAEEPTNTAGAGAFGAMAKGLTGPATSSTGGTITQTPTGLKHTAKPAAEPAPAAAATTPAAKPAAPAYSGAVPQYSMGPTSVKFNKPNLAPAKKAVQTASKQNNKRPL